MLNSGEMGSQEGGRSFISSEIYNPNDEIAGTLREKNTILQGLKRCVDELSRLSEDSSKNHVELLQVKDKIDKHFMKLDRNMDELETKIGMLREATIKNNQELKKLNETMTSIAEFLSKH